MLASESRPDPKRRLRIQLEEEFFSGRSFSNVNEQLAVRLINRPQIRAASAEPQNPEIVYFDDEQSPKQLASLYTACHCLLAPYRGEGFGLPIVEAMGCGIPPIIPAGGPTDDFTDDTCAFRVPSQEVSSPEVGGLCGPALELSMDEDALRRAMRAAFEDVTFTRELGFAASERIRRAYTWQHVSSLAVARLHALAGSQVVPVSS